MPLPELMGLVLVPWSVLPLMLWVCEVCARSKCVKESEYSLGSMSTRSYNLLGSKVYESVA